MSNEINITNHQLLTDVNSLILLHGALGAKAQLEPLKALLAKDFEVHSLSFSGHGGVPSQSGYDMQQFSQDVQQYMADNEIEQADFFGYSMGGYVALTLAKLQPEKVVRIMTLGTKFDWNPESASKESQMLNPDVIQAKVPKFAQLLEERHQPLDWKEVLQQTADMMQALGNGAALTDADFSTIQHTVLITVGSADNMVSAQESETVAKALLNAAFRQLEGVPHPIEKVDLAILKTEICRFFSYNP